MSIPRYEVAPVTDEQWAEALVDYGRDRDEEDPMTVDGSSGLESKMAELNTPIQASAQSSPLTPLTYSGELTQRKSSGSLPDTESTLLSKPPHAIIPPPKRQSTYASIQSGFSDPVSVGSPSMTGLNLVLPQTTEEPREKRSARTSFGSVDAACMVDGTQGTEMGSNTAAFGIAYAVPKPNTYLKCAEPTEAEKRSGDAERQRLRKHYEEYGWLPAPQPSRMTRIRRKRAIRRLGLCCNQEESKERHAVMGKFSELCKQIFQTASASVSILLGDHEIVWMEDPTRDPIKLPFERAACGHAVLRSYHGCTVVADMTKDWRFRESAMAKDTDYKFYASAPLRYQKNGITVDIGTLCILDNVPRDTFDQREQAILLNLANMLVFQLITLQSEIMAKKSSAMYESCISFLRRSVSSDIRSEQEAAEKARKEEQEKERQSRRDHRRARLAPNKAQSTGQITASPSNRPRRSSRGDSKDSCTPSQADTPLTVKSGPRDSKIAKHDANISEKALFTDAVKTLRKMLRADAVAIVNIDEYQLFIRRVNGADPDYPKRKIKEKTKENIITSFLEGKPWPEDIAPVIHYVPRSNKPGVTVLGADSEAKDRGFNFDRPGAETTLSDFIEAFLKTRHSWWDREDAQDDLSHRLMDLMPSKTQTTLATAFLTGDGKARFAMFASWDRPPSEYDSQTLALPGAWIMGGCTLAALAVRKVRSLEQSQISYSNLQAHELRTPLHQILAVTQLLRSSMNDLAEAPQALATSSLTTTQQVRDLLPFLDAIDTSGKTLHGIVDNILSFLDLKGKDNVMSPTTPSLLNSPSGATQSLEVMFEELIHEACEEDKRSRRANGLPMCNIETVFEIVPPLLGELVTEDAGGALRRALSKILSNAYKFIESEGCVEIYVDDVSDLLPPEGCEDLALTKKIKIKVVDNGKGMDHAFVREKLGEPWAKEDPYATGSGLSVHLAYRIIDLMGGQMEITSGPGQGTIVDIEVAVPRRPGITPSSPEMANAADMSLSNPAQLAKKPEDIELKRKVALVGFDREGPGSYGRFKLAAALEHQYHKLGCELVSIGQADLVVMEGRVEETTEGVEIFRHTPAKDIVLLVGAEHEAHREVLDLGNTLGKTVRRFRKPATPSILRETLFPGHSKALLADSPMRSGSQRRRINAPERVSSHGRTVSSSTLVDSPGIGDKPRPHFIDEDQSPITDKQIDQLVPAVRNSLTTTCPLVTKLAALWKPRNMDVEDAVACLSLGDYFSSRKRSTLWRTSSNASSTNPPSTADSHDFDSTPRIGTPSVESEGDRSEFTHHDEDHVDEYHEEIEEQPEEVVPEEPVKVLVVEDNMVNRKILVKILSSKLPIEVLEAEDGQAAVEMFRDFTAPVIVLLDINMPKMDGYQACVEMRAIEKAAAGLKRPSQIIAVTALSGEGERHRGLVECGMDQWHTKPCSKAMIHKIVEEARQILVNTKKEIEDALE